MKNFSHQVVPQHYPRVSWLTRASRKLRSHVARATAARLLQEAGPKLTIMPGCQITGGSRIAIGPECTLFRGVRLEAIGAAAQTQLRLGKRVSLQALSHIGACLSVEILDGTVLASGVYVTDHDHDYRDPRKGYFGTGELLAAPVRIGPRA